MKRIVPMIFALLVLLTACGKNVAATWQEQYDLGVRYLSEGNYEEAIIAFTAAIEIDPKQASTYIGLADAYVGVGDVDRAKEILGKGLNEANDADAIQAKIDEISVPQIKDGFPKTERIDWENGEGYEIQEYNEYGLLVKSTTYRSDGTIKSETVIEYNDQGQKLTRTWTEYADGRTVVSVLSYDGLWRPQKRVQTWTEFGDSDGDLESNELHIFTSLYEYTENSPDVTIHLTMMDGNGLTAECSLTCAMQDVENYVIDMGHSWSKREDGSIFNLRISHVTEYDKAEKAVLAVRYDREGNIESTEMYG